MLWAWSKTMASELQPRDILRNTVSKSMLRTRLVPLVAAVLLRKVGASPPLRQLTVSSSVYRQCLREEMGNQVSNKGHDPTYKADEAPAPEITFTDEELRSKLTAEEYHVTQEKGTERAWSGQYVSTKEHGVFNCVVCGTELFRSDKKFESGSGWPSFSEVAKKGNVVRIVDESHGMLRTEVVCGKCRAHLGHVFDDGPKEDTGLRYCINSVSLKFNPDAKSNTSDEATKEDNN